MRFPHWLKTVASALVLTATAGPALAQGPGTPGGGQPMYQPAYSTNDPGVLYPQGTPSNYQPYPTISPYGMGNVAWDQTFRDNNGLWFERIMHTNRDYFASLDVTYNHIRSPGSAELGSAHVPFDYITNGLQGFNIPTYGQGGNPGTTAGGGNNAAGSAIPAGRTIVDTRVLPYPILVTGTTGIVTANNHLFPIRSLGAFGPTSGAGLQGRWGFFNEDGSGMAVSAFWTGQTKDTFTMGEDSINGVKITQAIITASDGALLFTRNGAIPLNWGHSDSTLLPNVTANLGTAKYDLLFHYDVKTSAIGTDTNFFLPLISQGRGFKLRSFVGGRYLNISDQFYFRGIDSGFGYTLTNSTTAGGGGGGGQTTGNTFRPDPASIVRNYGLYEATLTNNVRTNLAGPQIGLRLDLGETDNFHIWAQSAAGLMANREDYHQFGNNIGDQQGLLLFAGALPTPIDMLASNARFNSTRTVNHVSPLFEQSFNAEIKILDKIPGIRRLPGIEDTKLRIGYTATVVGQVARAGDSIDWRGFPQFPSIHPGRETWWTSRWNFGIEKRW